jgi:hypothetical protein
LGREGIRPQDIQSKDDEQEKSKKRLVPCQYSRALALSEWAIGTDIYVPVHYASPTFNILDSIFLILYCTSSSNLLFTAGKSAAKATRTV